MDVPNQRHFRLNPRRIEFDSPEVVAPQLPAKERPNDNQNRDSSGASNSCIGCFRGDVNTGFAAEGEAEFIVVVLQKAAGIPPEEARATFNVYAEQELGCAAGEAPTGRVSLAFASAATALNGTDASSAFLAARSPATAKTRHEETARVGIARQQFKALLVKSNQDAGLPRR